MIKTLVFALFLTISSFITAQTAKSKSIEAAEKIKVFFNEKKYPEIYALLSPEFKKQIAEKDLSLFLNKNIYMSYGEIESNEFLSEDKDYQSFICHFKHGELQMNLSVNASNEVEMLQFVPYQSTPRLKITNYLSDNKKVTPLDSLIEKLVKDYIQSPQNCGLSIGILQNGITYFYNYGEVKRDSKTLATQNSIYEIGSVSKTFCAILLAKAIQEKKVKATDDIRLYLPKDKYPNLEVRDKPIQLIHLANHTSGLPRLPDDLDKQPNYDPLNPYKNYDKQMLFKYLKRVTLVSDPGKVCEYSNIGMALLGIILERIYNKPFEELVAENISKPFNMKNTAIKLTDEQLNLFCTGYNSEGNATPYWDLGDLAAAGGIRSTSFDMLAFLKENLEEKDEALKLSHLSTFNNGYNIALGWHLIKTKQGNNLVWHNGGTFGFSSFCGFIKEKNCAIVILSNSGMPVDPIALGVLKFLQQ